MAENPLIKRYLDAGMAFTQMTQARAEAIVKDLVKAGEVQAAKTEDLVNQLVERSRKNTDRLLEQVRKEVRQQVSSLGLATKEDLARVERKVSGTPARKKSGARKSTKARKKSGGRKSAARKKSGTRKSAAKKKSGAKKAGAKKAGAKKAGAKKAGAKKTAAKKSASS